MLSIRTSYIIESNFTVVKTDYESYAVIHKSDGYIYHSSRKNENKEQCADQAKLWSRTRKLPDNFDVKVSLIFYFVINE